MSAELARKEAAVYSFPETGQDVRIVTIGGDPWFVAADVCRILDIGRPQDSVRHLDGDERGRCLVDTPSGAQQMLIVSEPGLYSLMLRSRKPEARSFRRWVLHEVLPAIRKTGGYGNAAKGVRTVDTLSRRDLAEMIIAEADRADAAESRAAELEPAAEAWEVLAEGNGNYSLREAAAILTQDPAINIGQNRLMTFIRDEAMVDAKGRPYARYNRYLVQRPVSYNHPRTNEPVLTVQLRITPEGVAYLRPRLGGIKRLAA